LDFKDTEKVKIQHTDDKGFSCKIEVGIPLTDGSMSEGILYTICEFSAACKILNLVNGDDLFNNFRLCLVGNAKEEWKLISKSQELTTTKFEACIHDFKLVYKTCKSKVNLLEYLQFITKPKDMDINFFDQCIQSLKQYAKEMSDDSPRIEQSANQDHHFLSYAIKMAVQQAFIGGSNSRNVHSKK